MPREITVEPQGPVSRITQDAVRDYMEQIDRELMNAYTCTVPIETSLTTEMLIAAIRDLTLIPNCRCVVNVNGEEFSLELPPLFVDVPPRPNMENLWSETFTQEQMDRMQSRPNMSDTFDYLLNRQLRVMDYGREGSPTHDVLSLSESYRYRDAHNTMDMLEQDMRALLEETAYLDEVEDVVDQNEE